MVKTITRLFLLGIFIAILNFGLVAYGCSCSGVGSFVTHTQAAGTVIYGKVLKFQVKKDNVFLAMDVEVLEVLKGEVKKKVIRVWGDNGMLCRPYVTQFPVGTEWIFILNSLGSNPGDIEKGAWISVCGVNWLSVKEGVVIGNISNETKMDAVEEMPLADFRDYLVSVLPKEGDPLSGLVDLEADCKRFLDLLDSLKVAQDYPELVRKLLSLDTETQIVGLQGLASIEDPNVIPWLIPYLDSPNNNVRVYAGLALEKTVTALVLKNKSTEIKNDHAVLNLRSLAWVIQKMFEEKKDPNLQGYATIMAGYLDLKIFIPILHTLLKSEHPAVVESAQEALKKLGK